MPARELLDAAERSKIPDAFEGIARVRAAALLREAARLCEVFPWAPGAAERFMTRDEFENVMQTNQGDFQVIIRRR